MTSVTLPSVRGGHDTGGMATKKYETPPFDFGKDWRETREKELKEEQAKPKKPNGIILVHPNPNDDGYADNWVCEHIDMQPGHDDGEVWLCEACTDLDEAGAKIVKVNKASKAGK